MAQRNPVKTAPTRSKVVTSRNLTASTASTRHRVASASGSTTEQKRAKLPEASTSLKGPQADQNRLKNASTSSKSSQSRAPLAKSVKPANRAAGSERQQIIPKSNGTHLPVTAGPLNGTVSKHPPQPSSPLPPAIVPSRTADALQIAAQLYPWLYMTSSLQTTFRGAESSAQAALKIRAEELENEEADIADQRLRFETEKLIALYDELSGEKLSAQAPSIMQAFLQNSDAYAQVSEDALRLSNQNHKHVDHQSPVQVYDNILIKLDNLHIEATNLTSSITQLCQTDSLEPPSAVLAVFSACVPVLEARISNLSSAQELVQSAKENLALRLEMESLQIST